MNKWYLYQYIYISASIELIIHFFKLHEIINKHVLAYVCYYSFLMKFLWFMFFSKVQIFFLKIFYYLCHTLFQSIWKKCFIPISIFFY